MVQIVGVDLGTWSTLRVRRLVTERLFFGVEVDKIVRALDKQYKDPSLQRSQSPGKSGANDTTFCVRACEVVTSVEDHQGCGE